MILRCDSCKGTEFEVESFELVRRTFDSADTEDPWSQSEPLEESYVVSVHCADCDKEYPPGLLGIGLDGLRQRVRELGRQKPLENCTNQ